METFDFLTLVRRGGGPLAALLALGLLGIATILTAPDTRALTDWQAPPAQTFWLPQPYYGLPRRPGPGETPRPVAAAPRGGIPGQAYFVFDRAWAPAGPATVLIPAMRGSPSVYANGAGLRAPEMGGDRFLAIAGAQPVLVSVPASYFRPGLNRVDLLSTSRRGRILAVPMIIGPEAPLRAAAARLLNLQGVTRRFLRPLSAVAAGLCLAAALARRRMEDWLLLAAFATAMGTRIWLASATLSAGLEPWWAILDAILLLAGLVALWTPSVAEWPRPAVWAAGAVATVVALSGIWGASQLFSGLWLLQLEAAHVVGLAALLAGVAARAGVAAGLASWRLARDRLDLTYVVRRQRDEIDAAARALTQEMRRTAILEERQRLARDMHDGIGGQLVSLIARLRTKRIDAEQVETELTGGLAELRLMVDSLDASGDTLAEALTAFRTRAQPQAEAAGMVLRWQQPPDLWQEIHDPRWVLNLYRLLQEAVANAARHSGGGHLDIVITRDGERSLGILVADDGAGIPDARRGVGKGLANMAFRARQMGADLSIESGEGGRGTRVRLTLSPPTTGADQSRGEISPS